MTNIKTTINQYDPRHHGHVREAEFYLSLGGPNPHGVYYPINVGCLDDASGEILLEVECDTRADLPAAVDCVLEFAHEHGFALSVDREGRVEGREDRLLVGWGCDGGGHEDPDEQANALALRLPTGNEQEGAGANLCRSCWNIEMVFRRMRNNYLAPAEHFPVLAWPLPVKGISRGGER